jgi:hypothetical protein
MLFFMLMSVLMPPEGKIAAMEAFSQGRMNLVYIGELPPEGYRDTETGMLLESLGCEWDLDKENYSDGWNSYMQYLWSCVGSDSTYFVIRTETESLEYRNCELVYRDAWGSVPIDIFPEEFAGLLETSGYSLRDTIDNICWLEMYTPLQEDTIRTEIPVRSEVVARLFDRGRREIQRNQMVY